MLDAAATLRSMETIELYTRPGCAFCMILRHRLRKAGIEFREINIWRDPAACVRVRTAGKGNEIVPTVHVGTRWQVNPSINDIAALIHRTDELAGQRPFSPGPSAP